jgi:1-acyl-sn-glycerol-3-phosphate acyltransferase
VLLNRLNHGWRILTTGVAFIAIFGGGPILALVVYCVARLLLLAEPERSARVRYLIHRLFRVYIGMIRMLGIVDIEMIGGARLAEGGGRLIVANHPSLLDVVLLVALIPRAQCVVKAELWDSPMLRQLMRAAGYIRNDLPAEEMLAACRAALEAGNHLIIFPEGTRSRPGEPLRFRRGFAHIATMLDVQIQLVVLRCNPPMLLKGQKWWQVPARRPRFQVEVGNIITTKEIGVEEHRSLTTRKLVRHLEDYYTEQLANG